MIKAHCEHDRARISGETAELAGTEDEAGIIGVPPRIGVSQCRDEKRQAVGRHVKAIGNDGKGPEQGATKNFCHHRDVSEIAAHVLLSFAAWRSPRKTWLCPAIDISLFGSRTIILLSRRRHPKERRVFPLPREVLRIGQLDTINAFECRYKEFVYRHGREISTT
jgi:hypothetical protein